MARVDMVHTGFRHGDTAALGREERDLVLGDEVRCVPDAPGPSRAELDFGIRMQMGGYLAVAAGRIVGWTDTRDPNLPLFDSAGCPVTVDEPEPEPAAPVPAEISGYGPPSGCAVCTAVRSGGVERLRAEHRAGVLELRRANDEARAIRRRGALRPLPSWRTPEEQPDSSDGAGVLSNGPVITGPTAG